MQSAALLDSAGRRRSPATLPTFHQGRPPRNKGLNYPPDPPTVEEIITVMRAPGNNSRHGLAPVRRFPSAPCSASCAARPGAATDAL